MASNEVRGIWARMAAGTVLAWSLSCGCEHGTGKADPRGAPSSKPAHDASTPLPLRGSAAPSASPPSGSSASSITQTDPWVLHYREQILVFLENLQIAVKNGDKAAVADLVLFPVNVQVLDSKDRNEQVGRELFLKAYNQIVTPCVKRRILETTFDSIWANYQGFKIGRGQVWFSDTLEGMRIITFNNADRWCTDE